MAWSATDLSRRVVSLTPDRQHQGLSAAGRTRPSREWRRPRLAPAKGSADVEPTVFLHGTSRDLVAPGLQPSRWRLRRMESAMAHDGVDLMLTTAPEMP
jgi:hypothetical protein